MPGSLAREGAPRAAPASASDDGDLPPPLESASASASDSEEEEHVMEAGSRQPAPAAGAAAAAAAPPGGAHSVRRTLRRGAASARCCAPADSPARAPTGVARPAVAAHPHSRRPQPRGAHLARRPGGGLRPARARARPRGGRRGRAARPGPAGRAAAGPGGVLQRRDGLHRKCVARHAAAPGAADAPRADRRPPRACRSARPQACP